MTKEIWKWVTYLLTFLMGKKVTTNKSFRIFFFNFGRKKRLESRINPSLLLLYFWLHLKNNNLVSNNKYMCSRSVTCSQIWNVPKEKDRCVVATAEVITLLTPFIPLIILHFHYVFMLICWSLYRCYLPPSLPSDAPPLTHSLFRSLS